MTTNPFTADIIGWAMDAQRVYQIPASLNPAAVKRAFVIVAALWTLTVPALGQVSMTAPPLPLEGQVI